MPLAPYATVAALKARLMEEGAERDAEIAQALLVASSMVERFCARDFGPGSRTERGGGAGSAFIMPACHPVDSVIAFTIEGSSVAARIIMGGNYVQRADRMPIHGEWSLTYLATAPIPPEVTEATLMAAQALLDAPAVDANLSGVNVAGVISGGIMPEGLGALPRGARSLLAPLARVYLV